MGGEAGWTTLTAVRLGDAFEMRDGRRHVCVGPDELSRTGRKHCIDLGDRTRTTSTAEDKDLPVRILTPVPVAPSLPADLKALLLGALATGETDVLEDFLLERRADPDVRETVRRNVLREIGAVRPPGLSAETVREIVRLAESLPPVLLPNMPTRFPVVSFGPDELPPPREHRVEGNRCVLCGTAEDTLARNSAAGIHIPCSVG